jgi:hypothetical protein
VNHKAYEKTNRFLATQKDRQSETETKRKMRIQSNRQMEEVIVKRIEMKRQTDNINTDR